MVASVVFAAGLLLPGPSSDAARSGKSWPSGLVNFEMKGDWSVVSASYRNAVRRADDEWRNNTRWDPVIVTTTQDNGIYWGNDEDPWATSRNCTPPIASDDAWGKECRRFSGTTITRSQIMMNTSKSWNSERVQGIMTHELGHSAGLSHDPLPTEEIFNSSNCDPAVTTRWTMCAKFSQTNASWASTTEWHDRNDADAIYQ